MKHYRSFSSIIFSLFGALLLTLTAPLLPALQVSAQAQSISFTTSGLTGLNIYNPTSLQFGPDERLYVAVQDGEIYAFDVERNGANQYSVTGEEEITLVKEIPNHDDDGDIFNGDTKRQVTGLLVVGTPEEPVLYVTSSDYRIGAGSGGSDSNLDTNSGIISRLTYSNGQWDKVDIVRGLPRSEENHATNGMQLDSATNTLYLAVGGSTNAGSPSANFAFANEYALSAAILSIDLDAINSLSIQDDGTSKFIYDIPTLDDPERSNDENGADINDPFGGNDGLNQAKIVPGGPVQIYSPGYRNAYDVVLTADGDLYTIDNGANAGWGGFPDGEAELNQSPNCTNDYDSDEPGSSTPGVDGEASVNNLDNLQLVTQGAYGGHPNPIRGNPSGAGLYTHNGSSGVWRTSTSGSNPLPADWPPVPSANAIECDFQNPDHHLRSTTLKHHM